MTNGRKLKNVLVVGDFMVDEHWATGIHRSPTARRTGRMHHRALNSPGHTIQSLAGAGLTAAILNRVQEGKALAEAMNPRFNVAGIGYWHLDDTPVLREMLVPTEVESYTPHKQTRMASKKQENGTFLKNLAELGKDWVKENQYNGTSRLIRIYQHVGADVELVERIDWELNVMHGEAPWIRDTSKIDELLSELDDQLEGEVDAIVVNDMLKGVVTPQFIRHLAKKYSRIPWYILSKLWPMPKDKTRTWFHELVDIGANVELLFVSTVAAESAIRDSVLPCWITNKNKPSQEALEQIVRLRTTFTFGKTVPLVATLPRNGSLLFCGRKEGDDEEDAMLITKVESSRLSVPGDTASMLFTAMTASILLNHDMEQEDLLKNSLCFARRRLHAEEKKVKRRKEDAPVSEERLCFTGEDTNLQIEFVDPHPLPFSITKFDCQKCITQWRQALSNIGVVEAVVETEKRNQIQLWRTMTLVDGYVHHIASKKQTIRSLLDGLESFTPQMRRSRSYMLVAPPGSGKTTLIKRLADTLDYRQLSFNLTRMTSETDILDCLDTIITEQSTTGKKRLLVFVDEINSLIGGSSVYSSFLSPIEEGVFVRAGRTFKIQPCVWLFADTKGPEDNTDSSSNKANDFCSRLTLAPLVLGHYVNHDQPLRNRLRKIKDSVVRMADWNRDSRASYQSEAQMENVYLGVCLIRAAFPDVNYISEKALTLFRAFSLDATVREIRQFVDSFNHIQYGQVLADNIPADWIERKERLFLPDALNVYRSMKEDMRLVEVVD